MLFMAFSAKSQAHLSFKKLIDLVSKPCHCTRFAHLVFLIELIMQPLTNVLRLLGENQGRAFKTSRHKILFLEHVCLHWSCGNFGRKTSCKKLSDLHQGCQIFIGP
jgi:hypothetical protein